MIEVVKVSLENEMDLTLAYKKSIKVAELLGLTVSTQTAFATAVSEVSREVIDKTHNGMVALGVIITDGRFMLTARVDYDLAENFDGLESSFQYAKKLVPVLEIDRQAAKEMVTLQMGIPKSAKVDRVRIDGVKHYFEKTAPTSAYEQIKQKNLKLARLSEEQEMMLKQSKYLNEQKNEFLSVASHELKNPLTIIKAYAQIAGSSNEPVTPAMAEYLKKIEVQATKLHALVQQLFDVSKIESGQFDYRLERTDMARFLNDTLELVKHTIPGYELKLTGDDMPYWVSVDRIRIEQVLNNLIGNAAKYSPKGSTVEVIISLYENQDLLIAVKDYGIGMSQDALKKVFEKFYRAEEVSKKYTGLGMGLYIASKIVSDHQGKIWVESEPDSGSTFFFTLPLQTIAEPALN